MFRAGLELATTAQPAIGPLAGMVKGLVESLAGRRQNAVVQKFALGLDFSAVAARARLAEGNYIAVQMPPDLKRVWRWNFWHYHPATGMIVDKGDSTRVIPYNYVILGVSRMA